MSKLRRESLVALWWSLAWGLSLCAAEMMNSAAALRLSDSGMAIHVQWAMQHSTGHTSTSI